MPSLSTPMLTLASAGSTILGTVHYTVSFSETDRVLWHAGYRLCRVVELIGDDLTPRPAAVATVPVDELADPNHDGLDQEQVHHFSLTCWSFDEDHVWPIPAAGTPRRGPNLITGKVVWLTSLLWPDTTIRVRVRLTDASHAIPLACQSSGLIYLGRAEPRVRAV